MAILGNISVGLSLAGAYLQWLSTQCYRTITCGKHPLGWSPEEEKLVTLARVGLGSASTDIVRSLEKHWMLDSKPIKGLQLSCVPAATFQTPGFRDSWWISLNPEQQPKQAKTSVAICFIHGGAFRAGDPLLYHTAYKTWLQGLAKLGVHARLFAVGYPLAPENRFPVPVQGCVEAYQWLVKQEGGSDHVILGESSRYPVQCCLHILLFNTTHTTTQMVCALSQDEMVQYPKDTSCAMQGCTEPGVTTVYTCV
eukprot:GHUV01025620.1.p1 GENE.GHUV01025620.1~~GHUV01025620.1.p1  ORF type:complete len:253 (+),score=31.25 GHUV01025620.1:231-989(+)